MADNKMNKRCGFSQSQERTDRCFKISSRFCPVALHFHRMHTDRARVRQDGQQGPLETVLHPF